MRSWINSAEFVMVCIWVLIVFFKVWIIKNTNDLKNTQLNSPSLGEVKHSKCFIFKRIDTGLILNLNCQTQIPSKKQPQRNSLLGLGVSFKFAYYHG
jgi:hypothetical protein